MPGRRCLGCCASLAWYFPPAPSWVVSKLPLRQVHRPVLRQRYEQIAATLEAQIRAGSLSRGDRLPGERLLARQLGVSRTTVREALGALQNAGLVEIRQGAGSYVVDIPQDKPLLSLPADASPSALLEARAIFEPAIASRAACQHRHDDEITRLLTVMAESEDATDAKQRQRWSDADRHFHRHFAYMTGNTVLIAIADHFAELMDEPLWRRMRDESIAVPGHTTLYLAEHRLIAAAVAEGNSAAAAFHAGAHIERTRQYMALTD